MAGAAAAKSSESSDGMASSSRTPTCFTDASLASCLPSSAPGLGVLVTSLTGFVDRIQSATRFDSAVAKTSRPVIGTSSSPSLQYGVKPVRWATALGRTKFV